MAMRVIGLLAIVLVVTMASLAAVLLAGVTDAADDYTSSPLDIRIIHDFLDEGECRALREAATRKGLAPSTTVSTTSLSSVRTSDTVFLSPGSVPAVERLRAKVSALLDADASRFEDVQVIRYDEGEEYKAHYDPCVRCQDGGAKDLRREFTVLVYLSDDFEGGETQFPLARVSVRPRTGTAVVFRNMHAGKIVRDSKHLSTPVSRGVKWAATVWVRP